MNLKEKLQKWQHLFGMAENAGWLSIEKALRLGTGFFIGIYLARYFGPERFSPFEYALAIVVIFRALAGMGLRGVFVRNFTSYPDKRLVLLGSSALMITVAGAFAYLFALLAVYFLDGSDSQGLLLVAILAGQLLLYPTEVINYFFEARVLSKHTVIARIIAYLIGAVIKLLIVWYGGTVVHLALAYLVEFLIVALLYLRAGARHGINYQKWEASKEVVTDLFQDGKFLILAAVMVSIYMQIDKIMLVNLVGDLENGQYSFAVRLAEAFYFIPVVVQQSAFPNLVTADRRDQEEFKLKIVKLVWLLTTTSVCIGIVLTLISPWLIEFLAPGKFPKSGVMLSVVIWALPFVGLGVVQSSYLIAKGLLRYSLYLTTIGVVVNLCLNYYLIPAYGGIGAAWATVISYATAAWLAAALFPQTRPLLKLTMQAIFTPWRFMGIKHKS
ncbi:flippase [Neolewinella agarilytica]|uniref:Membrane protein involved in the export of O-antigen and teichoic acid n=1 Tax=Neolewinella agarilytica TaxID=478744 RepID=A0A1H9E0P2_9BACT|nr:flippase [Neolewinella agarilytica]SEQ19235.1 Membrane protein involved in the export of O-antigen and teichoic acid [Neolewinella agarilytica]